MTFVDTGAFVARYIRQDSQHRRARRAWAELDRSRTGCFTSSFVLDETFTLLGRTIDLCVRRGPGPGPAGLGSPDHLRPDADDETAAVELFAKFADQQVSFTDCVSFVLMRRHRLERAFTFDRHFADAGFEVLPRA